MGNFSYICNHCKEAIKIGENVHLKHIRHGFIQGETEGEYDGYGRIVEDEMFRNNNEYNINSHLEMWNSEFNLLDSIYVDKKFYNGKWINWMEYRYQYSTVEKGEDLSKEMYELWDSLEKYTPKKIASGIAAWHLECWLVEDENRNVLEISEEDPEQGW